MTVLGSQVALTTAAAVLVKGSSAIGDVADLLIDTTSGVAIYLGGSSSVTSGNGFVISTAHTEPIAFRIFGGDALWGVTAATSAILTVLART